MNQDDSANPQSEQASDDWKSSTPAEILAILLHELRNPIAVMRGWTGLLSDEGAREHHSIAFEMITQKIDTLERLHQRLGEYIAVHRQSPGT